MYFLIRIAFWFSIVLLFLPIWPSGEGTDSQPVGAISAISAAQQAVGDLAGICERKPDVCETGKKAVHTITVRAREGARMAIEMLDDDEAAARVKAKFAGQEGGEAASAVGNPEQPAGDLRPTAPIPPAR
ncbi:MAG TPA: DUF5330 domain-containing protein [Mesorhizobium sp.]